MSSPVFVAGLGAISAIGNNVPECYASLQNSLTGVSDIAYLPTNHSGQLPVAEVKLSNEQLADLSGFSKNMSRTAMLSYIAAKETLNDSGIQNIKGLRTGFVSANTVGGMDKSENFYIEFLTNNAKGKLRDIVNHECGTITELVADKLGIKHHVSTISTACSSAANAIMYAARLIKHHMLDAVIAGGVDSLTRFTLNGFNTLMILDEQYSKPFDNDRKGLNLGEGAGYVMLVSERVAKLLYKSMYCSLGGYCNANDAYHQTASSPNGEGSFLAMSGALSMSGLLSQDIGYIHLHGTGTQNNDNSEGTAIKRLFGADLPKMSSTKAFTGHTLGAAAGVGAVFSAIAVQQGITYPNLRFQTPMEGLDIMPEISFSSYPDLKHVLANSFGFGGNCSSLVFSKL